MGLSPQEEEAIRRVMRDATLKRIAWAFGCAKMGSPQEALLREILRDRVQASET